MSKKKVLSLWCRSLRLIPRGNFIGLKRGMQDWSSNAVKERIAWAHYVSTAKPSTHLVEVTDEQHSGFFAKHPRDELNRFLGTFFPHPIRFRDQRIPRTPCIFGHQFHPPATMWLSACCAPPWMRLQTLRTCAACPGR
eukprot:s2071_g2.t3